MSAISVVMKQASRPAPSQSTIKNLPDDKKQTKVKFVKSDLNSPLPKRNKMAATRKPTNTVSLFKLPFCASHWAVNIFDCIIYRLLKVLQ